MVIRKENHDVTLLFIRIVLSNTLVEYSTNGRPLVMVDDYSLVIAPVVAELCTTSVALSAPPNSYQNNSQS